ncbi:MAG: type II toxin-antitoxin system Phd/YefM family antitoxin [Rhodoferax sp.]|nr:type II toxin-antitoxin system Phd/YefM family antitoxin [Rhodoferax sp.]
MTWNIAQAKQQFSEVVRLTAQEPQAIYNRDKPVAMLVNPDEFKQFAAWRTSQRETSLMEQFNDARTALAEAGWTQLPLTDRSATQRPNAFVQMLEAEAAARQTPPR